MFYPSLRPILGITPLCLFAVHTSSFSYTAGPTYELPSVVVSATRSLQNHHDALSDVVIISREELAKANGLSLIEVLQNYAGLEITQSGGPQTLSNVFIRGANSEHTLVLMDGQRLNSATGSTPNWANLPLQQIERIEIIKGPSSGLYGTGAIGGVIQLFTRQGEFNQDIRPTLKLGLGSNQHHLGEFSLSGGSKNLSYQVNTHYEKSNGFDATLANNSQHNPDRDGFAKHSLSGNLNWQVTQDSLLKLNYTNFYLNGQYDAADGFDDRARQRLETVSLHGEHEHGSQHSTKWRLSRNKDHYRDVSAYGDTDFSNTQSEASVQHNYKADPTTLFTIGLDYLHEAVKHNSYTPDTPSSRDTFALFSIYQAKNNNHHWQSNFRIDHNSTNGSEPSGSLTYAYDLNTQWQLGTSVGSAFRAPSFNDLYFPDYGQPSLNAERSYSSELNLRYRTRQLRSTLTVFHTQINNLINYQYPCANPFFSFGCANNINKAQIDGISWSTSWHQGNWRINTDIDVQNPRDKNSGQQLSRRSKRHASLGTQYTHNAWLFRGAWHLHSARFEDSLNTVRLGGYAVLDLSAQYTINERFQWLIKINNLTDKHYELAKAYAVAGRTAFIQLQWMP